MRKTGAGNIVRHRPGSEHFPDTAESIGWVGLGLFAGVLGAVVGG